MVWSLISLFYIGPCSLICQLQSWPTQVADAANVSEATVSALKHFSCTCTLEAHKKKSFLIMAVILNGTRSIKLYKTNCVYIQLNGGWRHFNPLACSLKMRCLIACGLQSIHILHTWGFSVVVCMCIYVLHVCTLQWLATVRQRQHQIAARSNKSVCWFQTSDTRVNYMWGNWP